MTKKRGMGAYCAALFAFLYLPLGVMFVFSFNDARRNVVPNHPRGAGSDFLP